MTFGCSFTSYEPCLTWPIFLSEQFDETYNFGRAGAGNKYIFNSIIEADTMLNFTSDDKIVVQWSGFLRFDHGTKNYGSDGRYLEVVWETNGDWNHHPEQLEKIQEFVSEEEYVMLSYNYMLATMRYLKARNIPYVFTSLYDIRFPMYEKETEELQLINFVITQGLQEFADHEYSKKGGPRWGSHPSNEIHYEIAKTIASALRIELKCHTDINEIDCITKNEYNLVSENFNMPTKYPILNVIRQDLSVRSKYKMFSSLEKYDRNSLELLKQLLKDIFTEK